MTNNHSKLKQKKEKILQIVTATLVIPKIFYLSTVKMFRLLKKFFKVFLFLILTTIAIVNFSGKNLEFYQKICSVHFEFREECFEFVYNDICVPWNTLNCEIARVSFQEHHCPVFDCSVRLC